MGENININELCLQCLLSVEKKEYTVNEALNAQLTKYQYKDKQDRALLNRLFYGTKEYEIRLDYVINQFSKTKVNKCKPMIRCILRLGVYEILFMDSVKDYTACNEMVKLAKKHSFSSLSGFVNGVLRNVARNKDDIRYPEKNTDEYLSVFYGIPQWMVSQWSEQYGAHSSNGAESAGVNVNTNAMKSDGECTDKIAERIANGSSTEAPLYVYVNPLSSSKNKLMEMLKQEGVDAVDACINFDEQDNKITAEIENRLKDYYDKYALELRNVDYLSGYDSFQEGMYTVQDLSSMQVGFLVGVLKDKILSEDLSGDEDIQILDMCAAPGSKSAFAAMITDGVGYVTSRDLTEDKVDKILENVDRLGIENLEAYAFDGLEYDDESEEAKDIVILDAPCSGLGVLRRKKDIRFNMTIELQKELAELQGGLIDNAVRYVKKGGYLIYSTCTTNREENDEQVKRILAEYDYELIYERQLLQGVDNSDGFYLALLRREK